MASTVIQPPIALVAPFADPVYALKSDNGTFKGLFTSQIGTNNAVMFQSNGYSFGWKPDNILYLDDANNMDVVYGVNPSASAHYWNNQVTYVGTTQLTSDVFECLNNQLKHTVSLVAPPRLPASYMGTPANVAVGGTISYDSTLSIVADGVKQTASFVTNGSLSFQDSTGKEVYILPKIFAQDANGDIADGSYKVTFNADGTISLYMMVSWLWLQTAQYPVAIDPTVVVNSAYDTSGNGGRKIVKLTSGRIVAIAYSTSTTYVYKSDDGTTWAQLCTISGASVGASIANIGNNCTILFNNSTTVYSVTFDGTTVTNTDQNPNKKTVDTQTAIQNNTTIASDGTGALVSSWSSTNITYPNSQNIRYSKSTDGGTTWSTPTQITTLNTTGWYAQNPCIVVNSSNVPTIVWETQQGSSVNTIMSATWNGTAWTTNTVYVGGAYGQGNACHVVDTNNYIHVFWEGRDATYPTYNNIRHSVSMDGGTTWSTPDLLTAQNSYDQFNPSVSIDVGSGNIYVFWEGIDPAVSATYYNIKKIVCASGTWGTITTITNNTANHAFYPQTLWSKFNMNSSDAIRYIWEDTQVASVKYDSVNISNPPNAPTLTSHANFDATTAQTFSWTFSSPNLGDSQSAYELQIVDASNGSTVVDTGKITSTTSSYTLSASTLTNGHNYQWRVLTYSSLGVLGSYSTYGTFTCAAAPSLSIVSPASDGITITTSYLTANWLYSDPAQNNEQSYEILLTDSLDNVLFDTGVITSADSYLLLNYRLNPTGSYKVKITATNNKGVSSAQAVRTFVTSFTPPATPTFTTSQQSGYIGIAITNPTPSGGQPTIAYNDVCRRNTGTTAWTRIATNIANNGTYSDYAVASGQSYDYKVTAVGNNQTSADSAVSSQSIIFRGLMIHQVSNPSGLLNLLYQTQPKNDEWIPTSTPMKFAGRKYNVLQFGENEDYTLSGQQTVLMDSDNQWNALNTMIRAKSTLCVRDGRGRKIFAGVVDLKTTDLEFGRQVDLEFVQVDFNEAV